MNNRSGIELKLIKQYPCEIIAVDEVGRAPLAGAVVVGGVRVWIENELALKTLLKFLRPKGVTDSKKLNHQTRQRVLKKLKVPDLAFREPGLLNFKGIEVSFVTWEMCHVTIDKENILASSLRAMKEAAQTLSKAQNHEVIVLIDGHLKLRWGKGEKSPWNEIPIVKGDSKSLLIGLASIIAKEKRDAFMKDMHELYPYYGFDTNAGYPTPAHRAAIKKYGPCPIHRRTFAGVKGVKRKAVGVKRIKKVSLTPNTPVVDIPAAPQV